MIWTCKNLRIPSVWNPRGFLSHAPVKYLYLGEFLTKLAEQDYTSKLRIWTTLYHEPLFSNLQFSQTRPVDSSFGTPYVLGIHWKLQDMVGNHAHSWSRLFKLLEINGQLTRILQINFSMKKLTLAKHAGMVQLVCKRWISWNKCIFKMGNHRKFWLVESWNNLLSERNSILKFKGNTYSFTILLVKTPQRDWAENRMIEDLFTANEQNILTMIFRAFNQRAA